MSNEDAAPKPTYEVVGRSTVPADQRRVAEANAARTAAPEPPAPTSTNRLCYRTISAAFPNPTTGQYDRPEPSPCVGSLCAAWEPLLVEESGARTTYTGMGRCGAVACAPEWPDPNAAFGATVYTAAGSGERGR